MAVNSNPSNLSRGFARRNELSPRVMEKQVELGRPWETFGSRRDSAPVKHPLAFSRERGSAGALTLDVPSMAELPRPFPGIHQLTQLCSLGISPSTRMLCPSSKTLCAVLGVTEPLWICSSAASCGFPSTVSRSKVCECSRKNPPVSNVKFSIGNCRVFPPLAGPHTADWEGSEGTK